MRGAVAGALIAVVLAFAMLAVYVGFLQRPSAPPAPEQAAVRFELSTPAFENMQSIPAKYTCDGADVSPPLSWSGYPEDTVSFVLIVEDPDAPRGIFTHWLVYDIPADVHELKEGVPRVERLPSGGVQGLNDFGRIGYGGPCPPPGERHRYFFRVYALNVTLGLGPGAGRREVLEAMRGHVVGEAELVGVYSR